MISTATTATSSTSSRAPVRLGRSGGGFDAAFTERVRKYLRGTFFINLFFTVISVIVYVTGGDGEIQASVKMLLIVCGVTAFNGMTWFLILKSRPTFIVAALTHGATTLLLSAAYTYVSVAGAVEGKGDQAPLWALIIVTLMLVMRAALIPSPAVGTAIIGTLSIASPVYIASPEVAGVGWVFGLWVAATAIIVVGITTYMSHTVYGVERRLRRVTQLGQYQLGRLLGRGGMGEVYLANHQLLQRPTAIKLLSDASGSLTRERFRQEVQTASGLTHPNTVEIYDYGRTPDGVFYFAMEYVEGATLEDIVEATGAMPPERVRHLLAQAAGALSEAHVNGLVHRDIKPSNIMLCDRGGIFDTVKVLDFGLASDVSKANKESSGGLTGTPLYLAPEAILQADGYVTQSDIYALGAVGYFLLMGHPPFASGDLVEVLSDHLASTPPDLVCDDAGLAQLLMRCLAKAPRDRPTDAQAFGDELEASERLGRWTRDQAGVWWSEHQEVITAHQTLPEEGSTQAASMATGQSGSRAAQPIS